VRRFRLLLSTFVVFVCAANGQQNTVIRTETNVVLVDTIVTGKNGAYIRDLTAKDFRVFEDNKEQAITGFSFESSSATSQPRSLVLFFDESSMDAADQIPARQAAADLVDAETAPNHKMAAVRYDGTMHVLQNFTDNAGRLKDALHRPSVTTNRVTAGASPLDDAGARNMLRSLRDLGRSLGALPGRKIVVLFAGSLPASSMQRSLLGEAVEACNQAGVAIYPVYIRSAPLDFGNSQPAGGNANSGGMLGGGRGRGFGGPRGDSGDNDAASSNSTAGGQQFLAELAIRTGGFFTDNSSELLRSLLKIAGEQNEYYALTYTPPDAKEGSCHKLRVKVDRGGATVRARNSYCTTKPLELPAGNSMSRDLEKRAAGGQAGNMAASVALPYFYSSPGVARAHVAAEIMPGALKFESQAGKLHAELNLSGVATAEDGDVRARFSDTLRFDFDNEAQVAEWRTKPLHYEKEFRITPGQYKFTLAFGAGSQNDASFGKVELPLAIAEWTGRELGLSGIALSREIHPAADAGLGLSIGDQSPLVAGTMQVTPFGSARFTKSEPGYFYLEVYEPGSSEVTLRARVLDSSTGSIGWDSGPGKVPGAGDKSASSIPVLSRLPFDALHAGSWRLEITASDVMTGKTIARIVDFEIQ
jgi:VWFA-related protein